MVAMTELVEVGKGTVLIGEKTRSTRIGDWKLLDGLFA